MRLVQRKLAQLIKNVDSKSWWVEGITEEIRAEYKKELGSAKIVYSWDTATGLIDNDRKWPGQLNGSFRHFRGFFFREMLAKVLEWAKKMYVTYFDDVLCWGHNEATQGQYEQKLMVRVGEKFVRVPMLCGLSESANEAQRLQISSDRRKKVVQLDPDHDFGKFLLVLVGQCRAVLPEDRRDAEVYEVAVNYHTSNYLPSHVDERHGPRGIAGDGPGDYICNVQVQGNAFFGIKNLHSKAAMRLAWMEPGDLTCLRGDIRNFWNHEVLRDTKGKSVALTRDTICFARISITVRFGRDDATPGGEAALWEEHWLPVFLAEHAQAAEPVPDELEESALSSEESGVRSDTEYEDESECSVASGRSGATSGGTVRRYKLGPMLALHDVNYQLHSFVKWLRMPDLEVRAGLVFKVMSGAAGYDVVVQGVGVKRYGATGEDRRIDGYYAVCTWREFYPCEVGWVPTQVQTVPVSSVAAWMDRYKNKGDAVQNNAVAAGVLPMPAWQTGDVFGEHGYRVSSGGGRNTHGAAYARKRKRACLSVEVMSRWTFLPWMGPPADAGLVVPRRRRVALDFSSGAADTESEGGGSGVGSAGGGAGSEADGERGQAAPGVMPAPARVPDADVVRELAELKAQLAAEKAKSAAANEKAALAILKEKAAETSAQALQLRLATWEGAKLARDELAAERAAWAAERKQLQNEFVRRADESRREQREDALAMVREQRAESNAVLARFSQYAGAVNPFAGMHMAFAAAMGAARRSAPRGRMNALPAGNSGMYLQNHLGEGGEGGRDGGSVDWHGSQWWQGDSVWEEEDGGEFR